MNTTLDRAYRKIVKAALALHQRPHAENLYGDRYNYELIKSFDDACAQLLEKQRKSSRP